MSWPDTETAFEALHRLTAQHRLEAWPRKGICYHTPPKWQVFFESDDFKMYAKSDYEWKLVGYLTTPLFGRRLHLCVEGRTPVDVMREVASELETAQKSFESEFSRLCEYTSDADDLWSLLKEDSPEGRLE